MTDKKPSAPMSKKNQRIVKLLLHSDNTIAMLASHPEITAQELELVINEALQELQPLLDGNGPAGGPIFPKRSRRGPSRFVGDAYQLKITLRGSKPPIWRRLVVPADIKLSVLHAVIQTAMGWHGVHLHCFDINGLTFQSPDPEVFTEDNAEDERQYQLCDLVNAPKAKFSYQYDFGDDWQHNIVVEKIIPASAQPPTMACLAGKGRCPPEDCGGIHGYYHLLEVLRNPHHPEFKDLSEWIGEIPDPDDFDCAKVSVLLSSIG